MMRAVNGPRRSFARFFGRTTFDGPVLDRRAPCRCGAGGGIALTRQAPCSCAARSRPRWPRSCATATSSGRRAVRSRPALFFRLRDRSHVARRHGAGSVSCPRPAERRWRIGVRRRPGGGNRLAARHRRPRRRGSAVEARRTRGRPAQRQPRRCVIAERRACRARVAPWRRASCAGLAHVVREAASTLCGSDDLRSVALGGAMLRNPRLTTELRQLVGDGLSMAAVPELSGRALGRSAFGSRQPRPAARSCAWSRIHRCRHQADARQLPARLRVRARLAAAPGASFEDAVTGQSGGVVPGGDGIRPARAGNAQRPLRSLEPICALERERVPAAGAARRAAAGRLCALGCR